MEKTIGLMSSWNIILPHAVDNSYPIEGKRPLYPTLRLHPFPGARNAWDTHVPVLEPRERERGYCPKIGRARYPSSTAQGAKVQSEVKRTEFCPNCPCRNCMGLRGQAQLKSGQVSLKSSVPERSDGVKVSLDNAKPGGQLPLLDYDKREFSLELNVLRMEREALHRQQQQEAKMEKPPMFHFKGERPSTSQPSNNAPAKPQVQPS